MAADWCWITILGGMGMAADWCWIAILGGMGWLQTGAGLPSWEAHHSQEIGAGKKNTEL